MVGYVFSISRRESERRLHGDGMNQRIIDERMSRGHMLLVQGSSMTLEIKFKLKLKLKFKLKFKLKLGYEWSHPIEVVLWHCR